MPPTPLDFHRATVLAYKSTLESRPAKEKKERVSIQIAQQANTIVDDTTKAFPEASAHLPQRIRWNEMYLSGPAGVSFLELEMMLNQVLAILGCSAGRQLIAAGVIPCRAR